jgi:cytoskeletal protein CcmA (bactofilin family)
MAQNIESGESAVVGALPDQWTVTERWAWHRISSGNSVDLDVRHEPLDPSSAEGWTPDRKISAAFLRDIVSDAFVERIISEWVHIRGALFDEKLTIPQPRIQRGFRIEKCRFEQPIDLSGKTIGGGLDLDSCHFATADAEPPAINLQRAKVEGRVRVSLSTIEGSVNLEHSEIDGSLDIRATTITGALQMEGACVTGSVGFAGADQRAASFGSIVATSAKIGDALTLRELAIQGKLELSWIVARAVSLLGTGGGPSIFSDVHLAHAVVEDDVCFLSTEVKGQLILDNLRLGNSLVMGDLEGICATFASVSIFGAKVNGELQISSTKIVGALEMMLLQVGGALSLVDLQTKSVNLSKGKIGGQLRMLGVSVNEKLELEGIEASGLWIENTEEQPSIYSNIILRGANVLGNVLLRNTTVHGMLDMSSVSVKGLLDMSQHEMRRNRLSATDLSDAQIGRRLLLSRATVNGKLHMRGLQVTGDLVMDWGEYLGPVDLTNARIAGTLSAVRAQYASRLTLAYARIDSSLLIAGMSTTDLDLSGVIVGNLLDITSIKWKGQALVTCRNGRTLVLREDGMWPPRLVMDGFSFTKLYHVEVRNWKSHYLENWLYRNDCYSPQPYEQLASALSAVGRHSLAAEILYASREMERKSSRWYIRFGGSFLLKILIGYGLGRRYFRSGIVAMVFIALGMIILRNFASGITVSEGFIYSLQKLLPPFAKLSKLEIELQGVAKWYFYLHQVIGFVIALFLTAGLAGLTQKPKSA